MTSSSNVERRARILLADDFEVVRTGLKALLGDGSWEICGEAENGLAAVEKVIELTPDLVVLDVTMPILNGFEAAREIRKLAPATKIVIFSMHESAGMVREAKESGADAYIVKSEGIEVLEKTITRLLENGKGL